VYTCATQRRFFKRFPPSCFAVGAFETVLAKTIVPGNKIVLMQDPADLTAGYHVSVVSTVEQVNAEGYYVPAVASPYIVADGAIVPL
jgi:hypothetical protein